MCGRYALYQTEDLSERYNLANKSFVAKDNYNVAPMQRLPVVYQENNERVANLMQWGFLPSWAKDPLKSFRPINTVSETAFAKPMWKESVKRYRALVPARGFYEWKKYFDGAGKVEHKEPFFIRPKDIDIYSFAGVYNIWKDAEDYPLFTFSIMTTASNEQMETIHNRMPVILRPEQEALWLNPMYSEQEQLASLLVPYKGKLEIYRVGKDVNSPRNNNKQLIEAVSK